MRGCVPGIDWYLASIAMWFWCFPVHRGWKAGDRISLILLDELNRHFGLHRANVKQEPSYYPPLFLNRCFTADKQDVGGFSFYKYIFYY